MFPRVGRFRRADRILRAREFSRVAKTGQRVAAGGFVVVVARRGEEDGAIVDGERRKLGIAVGRRVGNAVVRNRLKRRIREWFRAARADLPAGSDTVVIARPPARELSGREVAAALDRLVARAGSAARVHPRGDAR